MPRVKGHQGGQIKGGPSVGGTPQDYGALLAQFAQSLAPGGAIETQRISEINREAGMLADRITGGNIARGLGGADLGVEATVEGPAAAQRGAVRSGLTGQYLQLLQFLANMQTQRQQLDIETTATRGPTNAQRGLDAFGRPMRGTLAEAELKLAEAQLNRVARPTSVAPTAEQYPALYGAGGVGSELAFLDENPYTSGTMSNADQPVVFTTPMMGSSERWRRESDQGRREVGFI
jgi:hypothetical protein